MSVSTAVVMYESCSKAPKSSSRKPLIPLHVEPQTGGNAERIAKENEYAEKLERPETGEHETKMKGNNVETRSIAEDMSVCRRVSQISAQ